VDTHCAEFGITDVLEREAVATRALHIFQAGMQRPHDIAAMLADGKDPHLKD
jgi:hypothetical protein